jgi:hypothetical protein
MNSKGIGIALAVLAALVIATIFAYRQPSPVSTTPTNPWQRLAKDRVDHVSIHRPSAPADQQHLEFEKVNGAWRITQPGNGPTEARAVEDLLDRLGEMNVSAIAAHNTSSYETFEIDDAHATRVTLKNGSTALLDVFVGAAIEPGGTAVRVPGKPEVLRVGVSMSSMLSRAPRDWRDRDITQISRDSIRAVEWANRNGTFRFTRSGDTWTAAAGTTVERLDTAKVNTLVESITNLRASDFGATGAATGIGADAPRVTIETEVEGSPARITLRVGNNSGDQETFAQREGNDVVFIVSRTQADAINPAVSAFQAPLPVDGGGDASADASAPEPPPAMPPGMGMPPGMPGMPGGGGGQLPPELMEQIRRQIQQQQGGGAPH